MNQIHGFAAPGFEACFDAFAQNFEQGEELGAACAIYHRGELVLDVWGGTAISTTGEPWAKNTAVPVFSVTKGIAAICVLTLASQGGIQLDLPLAHYWPEFGVHGKDQVTVGEALAHRAGVPVIDGPISIQDLSDPAAMAERLARQKPIFEPGTSHLYHAITIGWITSELVRRVTGLPIGQWFNQHLATPHDLNIRIGRSAADNGQIAVVEVPSDRDTPVVDPDLIPARAITLNGMYEARLSGLAGALNSAALQRVELAGANGIADARSLARLYDMVLGSSECSALVSKDCLEQACTTLSHGPQFGMEISGPTWGAGLMLPWPIQPMLGPGSFGHDGAGGSLAFAHAPSGSSFAYVRNRTGQPNIEDPQVYRVVRALAQTLDISIPKY